MKFDLPSEQLSHIKVIGVGGGGSNAVNHMFRQGIKDVDFIVCNTDQQALDISPVPVKVQLGASLTSGLGAGSKAEVGENAAIESIEEIKEFLGSKTKMVFITAGMGGGTGTGAAPIIAKTAVEMGILTVGIVTMPFSFEGKKRRRRADEGINNMRESVDTLLVINNDKLREMFGNLSLENAFEQADNVLTTAAKGIAEAITYTGKINVDFNDVRTVMYQSGVAIMGSARAKGENRALTAVETAVNSPLLNENDIRGAANVLLNITYGTDSILMDEITEITDFIEDAAGEEAEVIWGHGIDDRLENDEISITIIATGFTSNPDTGSNLMQAETNKPTIKMLDDEVPTQLTRPFETAAAPIKQVNIFDLDSSNDNKKEDVPVAKLEPEESVLEPISNADEFTPKDKVTYTLEDEESESSSSIQIESSTTPSSVISEEIEEAEEESMVMEVRDEEKIQIEEEEEIETPIMVTPNQEEKKEEPIQERETVRFQLDDDTEETSNHKDEFRVSDRNSYDSPKDDEKDEEFSLEPRLKTTAQRNSQSEKKHENPEATQMSNEERQKVVQERMTRLRNLSNQLKTPSGITSIENEPAFKRRSVKLEDIEHSSDSQVSRLTLTETEDEDGNKKTELRSNNSFLHDNVD